MRSAAPPIAIVGMAGIFPDADDLDALCARLEAGAACADAAGGPRDVLRIRPPAVDLGSFGVPPAHAASMARVQLVVLEVVRRCLADAGDRPLDRDATDVIIGTCFGSDRAYDNALRVDAARLIAGFLDELRGGEKDMDAAEEELKARGRERFGGSAHDRLGEMASTIPARVAIVNRLRGRCLAVEAADATSFAALEAAVDLLRAGEAHAVVVAAAQLFDGPLVPAALAEKGLLAARPAPFAAEPAGHRLGEAAAAVLLKRLDDARRDGDRIRGVIRGVGLAHASRPGSFRYAAAASDRRPALAEALAESGCDPSTIQYVDWVGARLDGELETLGGALAGDGVPRPPVLLGSAAEALGHSLAAGGLAQLVRVALMLERRTLFPQPRGGATDEIDPARSPFDLVRTAAPWPVNVDDQPRRAALSGASFTGTSAYVVLEEAADPPRAARSTVQPDRAAPAVSAAVPIAVVGVGGWFAGARHADAFWRNNCDKLDAIGPLAAVDGAIYFDPEATDAFTTYSLLGSKVDDPDLVDGFAIPPRRLLHMDRAQKLALAVAREALASFGHPGRPVPDRRSAVIVGSSLCLGAEREANSRLEVGRLEELFTGSRAFARLTPAARARAVERLRADVLGSGPPLSSLSADGFLASGIAAVISNQFHLHAVPIAVEAACASSLAAIDLAMRGLASGRHDFVLAGGVDLPANARDLVICSSLGLLSPGRITPFDERADGVSVGEGMALFALRRLEDAVADGDRVLAVLRSVGASSDARSLVAPDPEGQALAIRRAFRGVDFAPDDVQYVEAHGTGTVAGDKAEVRALAAVYASGRRASPLALGSVKSMIGHSFAAAGAAGLLRAIFAVREKLIPPTIHLERVSPALELDRIPAYVATDVEPWRAPAGGGRRAAVSSMGTGGINYHLLLEEAPVG